jgi:hypothetical protein
MTEDAIEYMGYETEPEPANVWEPKMYRIRCKCLVCGNEYSWLAKSPGAKDRPCPKKACKEMRWRAEIEAEARNMAAMIESGRPPGHIGANIQVKAIDKTAEIVMQDNSMTDLKDNIRQGEQMAPKLAPEAQKAADNFFTAGAVAGSARARQMSLLGRRAIAGHFRNMAVPPSVVTGTAQPGEPILRSVGQEKLRGG